MLRPLMLCVLFLVASPTGCTDQTERVHAGVSAEARAGAQPVPAAPGDWKRPLFFPGADDTEHPKGAEGSWTLRRNKLNQEVDGLVVTAKFPRHSVYAEEVRTFHGVDLPHLDAAYTFTVLLPALRVERVEVDTDLPPVPATLGFVSPQARKKHAPRPALLLEFELAVSAVWRGGEDYESALRVRSRLVHRVDDRDIDTLVEVVPQGVMWKDHWSWLQEAPIEGPKDHVAGKLDPRPLFAYVWNEVLIPVPLDSLGWLKPWFGTFASGGHQPGVTLVLARGYYAPPVPLWTLEAERKEREQEGRPQAGS